MVAGVATPRPLILYEGEAASAKREEGGDGKTQNFHIKNSKNDMLPKPQKMNKIAPNVLITGTPGSGKTTTAELVTLAAQTRIQSTLQLRHIDVSSLVKEKGLHTGWNEDWQSYEIDEDKVVDELEPILALGGVVIDHHGCDFFPERWFDLVIVLQVDNGVLYERLQQRFVLVRMTLPTSSTLTCC